MSVENMQRPQQRVVPVQARSRRKMDAILDATAGLLAGPGLEAVSMLAIAQAAGVPTATVYHYFENRIAVLAALAERTMARVDEGITRHMAEFADQGDFTADVLLHGMYQAYREAPGYVPVLRALRAEPALQAVVKASNDRVADSLAVVLVVHAAMTPLRARRVAGILSEACEQVLELALMSDEAEARALISEMVEMLDVLLAHYQQAGATP